MDAEDYDAIQELEREGVMRPNVSQRLQGRHVVIEEYDPYIDDIDAMLDMEAEMERDRQARDHSPKALAETPKRRLDFVSDNKENKNAQKPNAHTTAPTNLPPKTSSSVANAAAPTPSSLNSNRPVTLSLSQHSNSSPLRYSQEEELVEIDVGAPMESQDDLYGLHTDSSRNARGPSPLAYPDSPLSPSNDLSIDNAEGKHAAPRRPAVASSASTSAAAARSSANNNNEEEAELFGVVDDDGVMDLTVSASTTGAAAAAATNGAHSARQLFHSPATNPPAAQRSGGGGGSVNKAKRSSPSTPSDAPDAGKRIKSSETTHTPSSHANLRADRDPHIFRRIPPNGGYVTITTASAERYYVRTESVDEQEKKTAQYLKQQQQRERSHGLLATPVTAMLREIEEEKMQKAIMLSRQAEPQATTILPTDSTVEKARKAALLRKQEDAKRQAERRARGGRESDKLWVDKYTPRRYTDLLSEEIINRDVLTWLMSWEEAVFGKKSDPEEAGKTTEFQLNSIPPPKQRGQKEKVKMEDRKDLRPEHKVILLCGPPGLGKTTLAHIACKLAGYRAVEINASDDRTADALIDKVRAACEMQSVFDDSRPNAIILDEIDGAMGDKQGKGAIAALVKLIQAKPGDKDKEKIGGKKGRGKKSNTAVLNRPIICTCNDQYAPALRPLRQIAKVFVFTKPSKAKLSERLLEICKAENMQADRRALTALCEARECDVRSCLNHLQFVNEKTGRFTSDMLLNEELAHKDVNKDRKAIWHEIFFQKANNQRHNQASFKTTDHRLDNDEEAVGLAAATLTKHRSNMTELINTLTGHGNYDKVFEGVHDHYVKIKYGDPTMEKTYEAATWLDFVSEVLNKVNAHQAFFLQPYIAFAAAGVHRACSTPRLTRFNIPNTDYICHSLHQRNLNIIHSFLSPENTFGRSGVGAPTVVMDVLTPLMQILAPNLRAINFQLMTLREKTEVANLIDTMVSLKMTFKQSAAKGFYDPRFGQAGAYHVDPEIHLLVEFDSVSRAEAEATPHWMKSNPPPKPQASPFRQLPNQLMEMLAREIEFETLRRFEQRSEQRAVQANAANPTHQHTPSKQAAPKGGNADIFVTPKRRKTDGDPADSSTSSPSSFIAHQSKSIGGASAAKRFVSFFGSNASSASATAPSASSSSSATAAQSSPRSGDPQLSPPSAAATQVRHTLSSLMGASKNVVKASPASKRKGTFISDHREQQAEQKLKARVVFPIHYKFHEGFTNAVRRPVLVKDFL